MALNRPTFIDLSDSRATSSASFRWNEDSPRVQHYDGDIPPSLSPLDAFAAHSRKLARELEETRKAGERRMSRLPPQHITRSLTDHQNSRPAIFRQLSAENDGVPPLPALNRQGSGTSPEYAEPNERPQSSYPRISGIMRDKEDGIETFATPRESMARPSSYFDVPRSESPPPLEQSAESSSPSKKEVHPATPSNPNLTFTLAPPNPAFTRKSYHESSDDDYTSSNAGSTFSQNRKLSSSSGVSVPHSPASPYLQTFERSPSINSIHSISTKGDRTSGSNMNYSRPISSSSLNNLMRNSQLSPTRQDSKASQTSQAFALPGLPTPTNSFDDTRSIQSDGFAGQSTKYTHSTWTLPRGRKSNRTSALFLGLNGPDFKWQEPMFPGTPPLEARSSYDLPLPSPGALSRLSQDTAQRSEFSFDFQQERLGVLSEEVRRPSSSKMSPSLSLSPPSAIVRPATSHSPSTTSFVLPPMPPTPVDQISHSSESRSNSTVRPTTARTHSDYQALSADEHVTKAIDLHQYGDLKESTYHLRIAAKQNHPTGMLLYALACRHGWGMRPSPREGVQWLRKAVDIAQLEVAEDEHPTSNKSKADLGEKKAHRAQFALSIYELGQCHLNGWGMDQDKALALRCFEIAGSWGDTDALTEAGFCYAEGIGCKKDLKKAAKCYREAEKKGVSMVGNSWIYKDKYNDDGDDRNSRSARKASCDQKRSKSKTRSIFTRKKN